MGRTSSSVRLPENGLENVQTPEAGASAPVCSLDIWKTEIVLRRSKIFIVIDIQIALSSVGAAYYGQHLHADLHPYRFRGAGAAELLKRFNVPHDQRYIFQPVDPD